MSGIDLSALRRRLVGSGREYWRSLEELADAPELRELLHREFSPQAAALMAGSEIDRRGFLQLMGASLALAGLGACTRQPAERILPYVKTPEQIVPGEPLFFATAMPLGAAATGLLVESHSGRPTKIEGNPSHPGSLGATDALVQASVLTLYDPDRSQVVRNLGEILPWNSFFQAFATLVESAEAAQGAGLHILSGTIVSPTLAAQRRELLATLPGARWHQYEPLARDGVRAGARLAFGTPVDLMFRFDRADSILSLDADFLTSGPGAVRYARDFASRRRPTEDAPQMSRLWVVESSPSPTGTRADERLALTPPQVLELARAVASRLGLAVEMPESMVARLPWIDALVADLRAHAGRSVVIAGEAQPAALHLLTHAINERLGNLGKTVIAIEPVEAEPVDQIAELCDLTAAMQDGKVETLLLLDVNPVYDAPADIEFGAALGRVRRSIALGLYDDETAIRCHWHLPMAHYLESWGDTRAYDGTVTILQPLIAPLYGAKTASEIVEALLGRPGRSAYEIVRAHWQQERPGESFERFWERSLNDGVVADTAAPERSVALRSDWTRALARLASSERSAGAPDAPIALFRADRKVHDGRFANNAWLQELPDAITKLTWDNAALVAPALAERLGLSSGDVVELTLGERALRAPVWLTPGHADGCITLPLGYGRTRAGRVGDGVGFDAYRLRTSSALYHAPGLGIRKTGERHALACTQHHHSLEGRPIVRGASLAEFREHPDFAHAQGHDPAPDDSLYPNFSYEGLSWGMAIDLNACVGCNACIVACQAENNIPVVGRDQVAMGREMQWIRIDRYYSGEIDDPETHLQPMLCQHCERAPCEVVCPVNATVHDSEGLNVMVYNRCVGTRYCSNNCPYKVRRFNFLLYADWNTETLKLQRNPDVTVRSRGVMEKCTYCIQRISRGRIDARREGGKIVDGTVQTACQQVCPAQAITFGDLNDPQSQVVRAKADPRNYTVLAELNTRPRTSYLAEVRNPALPREQVHAAAGQVAAEDGEA